MTVSSTLPVLDARLPAGATGLFTTRDGGGSAAPWNELNLAVHVGDDPVQVSANRELLAARLGTARLAALNQVHGRDVTIVDADSPAIPTADAMVTTEAGVALMVLVADCLPVLLVDVRHGVAAAAHAGRPGLAAGVLQATVEAMTDVGASARDTVAVIGPGICGGCYEVPADLRDEVELTVPGSAATTRWGTPSVDLAAGALGILERLGLGQIRRTDSCTFEDPQLFSYRRDRVTGRFAGVVMLTPSDE